MNLFEAKRILKDNGYELIKEGQLNEFLGLGKNYTESIKASIKSIDRLYDILLKPLHIEEYDNPFDSVKKTLTRVLDDKEKQKYLSKFRDNVNFRLYFESSDDKKEAYEKIMGTLVEDGLEFKEVKKVYAVDIGEKNDEGESKWTKFDVRNKAHEALKEKYPDDWFEKSIVIIKTFEWRLA